MIVKLICIISVFFKKYFFTRFSDHHPLQHHHIIFQPQPLTLNRVAPLLYPTQIRTNQVPTPLKNYYPSGNYWNSTNMSSYLLGMQNNQFSSENGFKNNLFSNQQKRATSYSPIIRNAYRNSFTNPASDVDEDFIFPIQTNTYAQRSIIPPPENNVLNPLAITVDSSSVPILSSTIPSEINFLAPLSVASDNPTVSALRTITLPENNSLIPSEVPQVSLGAVSLDDQSSKNNREKNKGKGLGLNKEKNKSNGGNSASSISNAT